jgi:hypothetical protein
MAIIVMTWENPNDAGKAKAADTKAKEWRTTVLKQPGLVEYNAFTGLTSGADMAVDSFASAREASAFLGSAEFAKIVSEMRALGVTNINTTLWNQHPDVPSAMRP